MKAINKFLFENFTLKIGDVLLVGRWKNRTAIVTGFGKDKNNQPTVKTTKGEYSLYRFRINELMPKDKKKELKEKEQDKVSSLTESLQVTPVIKIKKVQTTEEEMCPHCKQIIGEKEYFAEKDDEGTYYFYHSQCKDKGPIKKVTKDDARRSIEELIGK